MYDTQAKITFTGPQKSAFRSALTKCPQWESYRTQRGISAADLNTADMLSLAEQWGIDAASFGNVRGAAAGSGYEQKPRDVPPAAFEGLKAAIEAKQAAGNIHPADAQHAHDILRTVFAKQDGWGTQKQRASIERDLHKPYEAQQQAQQQQAQQAPTIASITPASTGADMAGALAALLAQITASAVNPEAVAQIVDERITKALEAIPTVKIEARGFDGESRFSEGHQHPRFKTLVKACASRMANGYAPNIWVTGPAGSGKTHGMESAAALLGLSFHLHGVTGMAHELLGWKDAGGTYHATPFRMAFEHGGLCGLDEIDGWENGALLALNSALSNGVCTFPDATIKRHPDCIVIGCANTWGHGATSDYVGRGKIDSAFLSRMAVRINWDYDAALETAISGNESFARRVIAARERARAAGLKVLITPRDSQAGAALIAAGMSPDEAAALTYLAPLSDEQRKLVEG